jgi:hypothetical protein
MGGAWTQISAAREKGCTLNELIEQAAQEGIDVSLNSLGYAMRRTEEKGRIQRKSPGISDNGPSQTGAPTKAQPPINNHGGSMAIRDSFSFEIPLDVENL